MAALPNTSSKPCCAAPTRGVVAAAQQAAGGSKRFAGAIPVRDDAALAAAAARVADVLHLHDGVVPVMPVAQMQQVRHIMCTVMLTC